jgi:hypothetical protein
MAEFVMVSVDGADPIPGELCMEFGKRVIYTLSNPPDQLFPDDDGRIEIKPCRGKPRNLQPVGKAIRLDNRGHLQGGFRKVRSTRKDLRGGLDCGSWHR